MAGFVVVGGGRQIVVRNCGRRRSVQICRRRGDWDGRSGADRVHRVQGAATVAASQMAASTSPFSHKFRTALAKEEEGSGALNRVGCYCTCEEYRLDALRQSLALEASTEVLSFSESLHFRPHNRDEESVFVFSYGAVVIWGMGRAAEQLLLTELRSFQLAALETLECDELCYRYGDSASIDRDALSLTQGTDPQECLRERLALSHALAQSVKLATFERSVQATITATRHLPAELARDGKISSSRRDISKNVGRLFVDRHNVYLHANVIDTPRYFWDYESHEWLYASAAGYLELRQREESLFRRLDMVRELYDLLGQELQFKHSSDLELVIIGLIAFEIVLTLAHDWVEAVASGILGDELGNIVGLVFLAMALGVFGGALLVSNLWDGKTLNSMLGKLRQQREHSTSDLSPPARRTPKSR